MSELTAYNSERIYWAVEQVEREVGDIDTLHLDDNLFYLKSEADKVIAELQSKVTLASLAEDCSHLRHKRCNYCSELQRQKYKRCLAKANDWRSYATFCGMQSSCHKHRGFYKTAEKWTWRECHAWKCVKRYKELAEKFK